ncbi:MAG: hypothetical protein CVV27_12555 [Candidatus Melainabacteria bacterium HGW-Melainabacteria-1]|nr:MAG: hypothetical protein CVV27_12555 [Candidatus Melainabacteria bacterium HGW-Melainabacteria-1]
MSEAETRSSRKGLWKPLLLLGIVIAGLLGAKALGLDQQLRQLQPWIASLGSWGPLAFVAIYVVASIAALPGSVLTLAAGVLFGSVWGLVWASLASTLAAGICFLIARYFARGAVEASLSGHAGFRRLDALTEKRGVLVVAITRLVPLFPFNLLNYGFGLTKIPFWPYLLTSWLCMLPGTALYVIGSDALKQALAQGRVPWHLAGFALAALGLILLLGAVARKHLQRIEKTPN